MAMTTGDILVETLIDWGVDVIFGLPGDGINGVFESLRKRQDRIKFIHVRHEESAAFMACGYAKYTGRLGACIATSGPGAIHLLNGLYDAKMDGQPVIAITGEQFHDLLNTHTQQDVDLEKLFENVCVYNERVMSPLHATNIGPLACRTAIAKHGVAHLTIPIDVQTTSSSKDERSNRDVPHHTSDINPLVTCTPDSIDLRRAAEILNSGKKVAILAGRGALGCGDEIEMLADTLAAPVVKALLGKAVIPDYSPYTTGGIGLLGTKPSQDALTDCDTLLIVGSSFPYIEFYPKPGQAKIVQIDRDPMRIALRCPVNVGLVGESKPTLQALLPMLGKKEDRRFLGKAQDGMKDWWDLMKKRATREEKPMKPQVVAWELGKRLRDDAIISCDTGTITTWFARQMPIKKNQMCTVSGNLATMAPGLPYAIAAQVAYPKRQSIAFVGDGGLSMLMAELSTCVKYDLPVKVVVLRNNVLGQIKWEQMVFMGNPEFGCDLEPIDFAAFARSCGGTGFTIEDPADCGSILEEALNTPGPVIVDAVVDQNEPPMPASITFDQAIHFTESLVKGTPERGEILKTVVKEKARELI